MSVHLLFEALMALAASIGPVVVIVGSRGGPLPRRHRGPAGGHPCQHALGGRHGVVTPRGGCSWSRTSGGCVNDPAVRSVPPDGERSSATASRVVGRRRRRLSRAFRRPPRSA